MEDTFLAELVLRMKALQASTGDWLIRAGEVGREMYVIDSGVVEVSSITGEKLKEVSAGEFLGEIALLTRERRTAHCRAVSFCELWQLTKEDLDTVLVDYPALQLQLTKHMEERLRNSIDIAETSESKSIFERAGRASQRATACEFRDASSSSGNKSPLPPIMRRNSLQGQAEDGEDRRPIPSNQEKLKSVVQAVMNKARRRSCVNNEEDAESPSREIDPEELQRMSNDRLNRAMGKVQINQVRPGLPCHPHFDCSQSSSLKSTQS